MVKWHFAEIKQTSAQNCSLRNKPILMKSIMVLTLYWQSDNLSHCDLLSSNYLGNVPFKSKNLKNTAIHVEGYWPSCLKSWATLLPLTGSESSIGVWITCRSPAPKVIVLYVLKREREALVILGTSSSDNRVLISSVCPDSSVSQWQPHEESQKLSRYMTN